MGGVALLFDCACPCLDGGACMEARHPGPFPFEDDACERESCACVCHDVEHDREDCGCEWCAGDRCGECGRLVKTAGQCVRCVALAGEIAYRDLKPANVSGE